MDLYKKVFGRIWAVWGLLMFALTMIIFFIPFLLFGYFRSEPHKTKVFISFSRVWMDIFLTLIGCPLSVKGRAHFKRGETYIVVCNHNSFMDVPVSSPGIPGGNKTIAKIEISRVPVFGLLYKTGSVLVDRKSEASRRESFGKMKDVLAMGLHMCIYPEGTRNNTNQPLKPFHDGAFKLAMSTGKSIIPALIFNSKKALPPKPAFCLLPYRLSMHFLAPVPITATDTVASLKDRVFDIMKTHYVNTTEGKTA